MTTELDAIKRIVAPTHEDHSLGRIAVGRVLSACVSGIALTALLSTAACWFDHPAQTTSPVNSGVTMSIKPSKPVYKTGEQISLTVTVTNTSSTGCKVSKVPDAAVQILSMTRDGAAATPTLVIVRYYNGFNNYFTSNLVAIGPAAELSQTWTSSSRRSENGHASLTTQSGMSHEALAASWPVDQVGDYTLHARYVLPTSQSSTSGLCRTQDGQATTGFSVTGG